MNQLQGLDKLIKSLRDQNLTVGFAESCTGGLLSSLLTEQSGISDIFIGSVVSYSNQVKVDVLGVQETSIKSSGAVSELVAQEMVHGVIKTLKAKVAVAITGIAGPSGGTVDKPVGTVCFAVCDSSLERTVQTTKHFAGDRKSVQLQAAHYGIHLLNEFLQG